MQALTPPLEALGLQPSLSAAAFPEPRLDVLVACTQRCIFQTHRFFVSWSGVLTLAYSGFPPALEDLKAGLEQTVPTLPPENPGSR